MENPSAQDDRENVCDNKNMTSEVRSSSTTGSSFNDNDNSSTLSIKSMPLLSTYLPIPIPRLSICSPIHPGAYSVRPMSSIFERETRYDDTSTVAAINGETNDNGIGEGREVGGFHVAMDVAVEPPIYDGECVVGEGVSNENPPEKVKRESKRAQLCSALVSLIVITFILLELNSSKKGASPKSMNNAVGASGKNTTSMNHLTPEVRYELMLPVAMYLSGYEVMQDNNSPQSRALTWMAFNDSFPVNDTEHLRQRYVLVVLYFSGQGEAWSSKYKFLSNVHECHWTDDTGFLGVPACSDRGTVKSIQFLHNGYAGTVPSELGHLKDLTSLSILSKNIEGSIPTEFGLLVNLTLMGLGINSGLSGPIPSEIGNLQNLTTLWLPDNKLSGSLPMELCQLTALQGVNLQGNILTGTVPPLCHNITSLKRINLSNNEFSGNIDSWCNKISNKTTIFVDKEEVQCKCC